MGLDNPVHLALLLVLVLLVFGAKRLPEMGRSLGAGMRGFRDSLSGEPTSSPVGSELSASTPAAVAVPTPVAGPTGPVVAPVQSDAQPGA